jgi:nitroreductase
MKTSINRRRFLGDASAAAFLLAAGCSDDANENITPKKENGSMEFAELMEARRSVRRYAKSEIAKDEMAKIVADALNAPSWKNSETTRYYAAIGDEAKNRMWKEALPGFNAANSADSAALVAVTFVPGESGFMGSDPADELGNMWGAYDCGLASSYFILAAKNRGWDTLIMGMRDVAKVKAILGIPESEILMSVIAVGKSAQKYMKRPRKPVAEVLKVN